MICADIRHALPYGKPKCTDPATSEVYDAENDRWIPVCQEWADNYGVEGARLRPVTRPDQT